MSSGYFNWLDRLPKPICTPSLKAFTVPWSKPDVSKLERHTPLPQAGNVSWIRK